MPSRTTAQRRGAAGRPLESPLAVAASRDRRDPAAIPGADRVRPDVTDRQATLAEFEDYLRTATNREGLPYQETTINAYTAPGRNLDALADRRGVRRRLHGREHDAPEVKGRPKTLGAEFVDDLLEVTGAGRARGFAAARDHAMIRILRSEGIRRQEILSIVMYGLPADVTKNPLIRLVPLKGARAAGEGRVISLTPATARALATYLRARPAPQARRLGLAVAGHPQPGKVRQYQAAQDAHPPRGAGRVHGRDAAPDPPHVQRRLAGIRRI